MTSKGVSIMAWLHSRQGHRWSTAHSHPHHLRYFIVVALMSLLGTTFFVGVVPVSASRGQFTSFTVPTPQSGDGSITEGPDGALWFTAADSIGRITTSGKVKEYPLPEQYTYLDGIVAGPDHALWFTEESQNVIGRVTTFGAISEYFLGGSEFSIQPIGITLGPDKALWFTEYATGAIGRITRKGLISTYKIPGTENEPLGITAGPDASMWFGNPGYNEIGRITTQ